MGSRDLSLSRHRTQRRGAFRELKQLGWANPQDVRTSGSAARGYTKKLSNYLPRQKAGVRDQHD